MNTTIHETAITFEKINKHFANVHANVDVSFHVYKGHIHGIVGENGAGKSTAMKILFGIHQPDSGAISVHGKALVLKSAADAIKYKIGMVHQHFMLSESHTVIDNILLQQAHTSPFTILNRKKSSAEIKKLQSKFGFQIDLQKTIKDLSVGEQQQVELLKILSLNSEIIILDEPTAVLNPQEIQELFKNLKILKEAGKTILIISHKLKEIKEITDEITVFRQGKVVANFQTSRVSTDEIAEAMVGRHLLKESKRIGKVSNQPTLTFENISLAKIQHKNIQPILQNINFQVHQNEIVGVAGVEGNGQNELIQALIEPQTYLNRQFQFGGKILYDKLEIQSLSTKQIHELPFALMPEDRLRIGVLPDRPLTENYILGHHRWSEFLNSGFYNDSAIKNKTQKAIYEYDIRPTNSDQIFSQLSGGNQQKLVVARELSRPVKFILAAHPTRGVDIGATSRIHSELFKARELGAGILLISSELDELLELSDRVLVMFKGQLVAEFSRYELDQESIALKIGAAMGGNP